VNTLREVLRTATQRLQQSGSDSARRMPSCCCCMCCSVMAMWLYAHDDVAVTTDLQHAFEALVQRREQGEPVAHLLGQRGFWTLDLSVNRHTLIPRPETEMLVEFALEKLLANSVEAVLDLGTGSGAIALAVKRERPACAVTAVDASPDALAVAHANARRLQLSVEFVSGHWFAPLSGRRFHLIVSNPPYIPHDDVHLTQGDVRFEPRSALVSGRDGLDDIRELAQAAPLHLRAGGWLALEHGHDQAPRVRAILLAAGFDQVASRRDLNGHERITYGSHHGESETC
jgi:release factor glutamine methyltransferase